MTTQEIQYRINGCPDMFDLVVGFAGNSIEHPKLTMFWVENSSDAAVTYGFADGRQEEGFAIGVDPFELSLISLHREDGSGNNWLFEGRQKNGIVYNGYVNLVRKTGWLRKGGFDWNQWVDGLLELEDITQGPGKWALISALANNRFGHETWVEFAVNDKTEKVSLNGLSMIQDIDSHTWMFHGYSRTRGKVTGYYHDLKRTGKIRFEKARRPENPAIPGEPRAPILPTPPKLSI